MILLRFSAAYADENLGIQKAFDNVAKYIKVDKKYKDFDVLEKKSDKFNIKTTQSSGKNFSMHSVLKRARDSFKLGDYEATISLLNQVLD